MDKNANEFSKYLKIFYSRRFLFIAASLLVMTVVIAGSYALPRQYKAASTVFIEMSILDELVKGIAIAPAKDRLNQALQVLRYDMLSREVLSKVLREMDSDTPLANDAGFDALVDDLQKRTQITIKGKEGLFIVSLNDKNPRFAQGYINTLVRIYVEQNVAGKREETFGASRFLDEQLALFKTKLDQAQNAVEVESLSLALETLQEKHARLKTQLRSVSPRVGVFGQGKKEDRLIQIEQQIGKLLLTYTENYPEVIRLKAELESLKGQDGKRLKLSAGEGEMSTTNPMHIELKQGLAEVEAEISSLAARKLRLVGPAAEKTLELQVAPENRKSLAMLEQERDAHRLVYEQLLQRRGQAEITKQMEIGDKAATFRIIDPAVLSFRPVYPDMVRMILMAIAAGLGAGAGLVLLLENMNASVFHVQQLRELGVEVCAIIPNMVDPTLVAKNRRRNLLAYGASGLYFSGILGILIFELIKGTA